MTQARKVGEPAAKPAGNRGKGRSKGIPNKTTVAVKEALTLAFQGLGGVAQLEKWARQNETEFYKLWAKMLPTEIKGDLGAGITLVLQSKDERL